MEKIADKNKIIIDLPFVAPSLNEFYANANPYFRSSIVKRLKNDVQWLLISKGFRQKSFPFGKSKVDIFVTVCFADKKHRDVDNYFPKPVIDALKGFLIINDDERYVNSCSVCIKLGRPEIKTVIEIKKAKYD
jgi:Holliday junction resolvase RusA-like endonuclease